MLCWINKSRIKRKKTYHEFTIVTYGRIHSSQLLFVSCSIVIEIKWQILWSATTRHYTKNMNNNNMPACNVYDISVLNQHLIVGITWHRLRRVGPNWTGTIFVSQNNKVLRNGSLISLKISIASTNSRSFKKKKYFPIHEWLDSSYKLHWNDQILA